MKFTIDLDRQWREWGYSEKSKAVRYLARNFIEGRDYVCLPNGQAKGRGGHNAKVYMLTEGCALKMARNIRTKAALDFKNAKLDATERVLRRLSGLSGRELAVMALEKLLEENTALQERVDELQPKAQAHDGLMAADGLLSMKAAAKVLGWGPNVLFRELRSRRIFYGTIPYQEHIDSGRFAVRLVERNGRMYSVSFVTPKGMEWLNELLGRQKCLQTIAANPVK